MTTVTPDVIDLLLGDRMDERTRALLTLLTAPAEDDDPPGADDLLNSRTPERSERARLLRRRYQEMAAELRELRFRNGALARALGACPNCWGETIACDDCGGGGVPGAYPSDPELYEAVVLPAVTRRKPSIKQPNEKGDADA